MSVMLERPEKGILQLTLNRAEKRNALDGPMVSTMLTLLDSAPDPTDRVLMIVGSGGNFCAGADLTWMKKMSAATAADNMNDALQLATLFYRIHTFPLPVIVLVQGVCLGGGMGIVCAADMVVAAEEASFGFPETRMGLVPSVVSPWVVSILGERQARYYFLTGKKIAAEDAKQLGFVQQVVGAPQLQAEGFKLADCLRERSQNALAETRRLLGRLTTSFLPKDWLESTAEHLAAMRKTPDAEEGLRAFLEKRAPVWQGRT